ncbi:methyltransferase [Chitinophaga sp. OAE865]|uniref:methyltransferase n=1 Tax=Chitinophaga sp. OAE865 TaxID=2817898 RepID=UPI001AE15795
MSFWRSDEADIADAYDFSAFQTIVDIGGGNGALLMHILRAVPDLQGIVFDEPYVAAKTREHIWKVTWAANARL